MFTVKQMGAYKINLGYGIKVSVNRVYRLFQKLNLPTMSTSKPFIKKSNVDCEHSKLYNYIII